MIGTSLQNFNLPQITNPLMSEQMAIYQCLLNLPTTVYRKFIICTDSQLCLQRLTNLKKTCILTSHILFAIRNLQKLDIQIRFTWIPAHSGNLGNEIVDAAAKALSTTTLDIYLAEDIKKYISNIIISKWQQQWTPCTNNLLNLKRTTEDWCRIIGEICGPNRTLEISTYRVLIGHSKLTHLHLLTQSPPPTCDACPGEIVTVHHILTKCRKYHPALQIAPFDCSNLPDLIGFINAHRLQEKL